NHPVPTGSLVIEVGARFPGIAGIRIDFKPAKSDPNGISDTIALLDRITAIGGQHILTNGTFTRRDIAIDIWGTSVDEVSVFSQRQATGAESCSRNLTTGAEPSNQGDRKRSCTVLAALNRRHMGWMARSPPEQRACLSSYRRAR